MRWGAGLVGTPQFFVVTHSVPDDVRLGLPFTFVTDGLEPAITRARAAAGGKDVIVMGGGDVVRQCVDGGLVDELQIHLAPTVIGAGTPSSPAASDASSAALGAGLGGRDPLDLRARGRLKGYTSLCA